MPEPPFRRPRPPTSWKAWPAWKGRLSGLRGRLRSDARGDDRRADPGDDPGNLGEGPSNRSTHAWNVPQGIGHRQSGGCVVTERPLMRRISFRLRSILVASFFAGLAGFACTQGLGGRCVQNSDCSSGMCSATGADDGRGTLRGSGEHHCPDARHRRNGWSAAEPARRSRDGRRGGSGWRGGSGRRSRGDGAGRRGRCDGRGRRGWRAAAATVARRRGSPAAGPRRRRGRRDRRSLDASLRGAPPGRSGRDQVAATKRTSEISYSRVPLPVLSVTDSPRSRPIMARASGAETAMRPALMSASWSPTTM